MRSDDILASGWCRETGKYFYDKKMENSLK